MLTVTLPQPLEERFRELAASTGRSVEECLTEAATRFLEASEEERHDVELARQAVTEYEREGGIPWEQVKRDLAL